MTTKAFPLAFEHALMRIPSRDGRLGANLLLSVFLCVSIGRREQDKFLMNSFFERKMPKKGESSTSAGK